MILTCFSKRIGGRSIRNLIVIINSVFLLGLPVVAHSSSSPFEAMPAEQDDVKSIDQINQNYDDVFDRTPDEQNDVQSINQVNDESDNIYKATPVERNDVTPIDKVND